VGVCREVAFSKFSAFQEYIKHVCVAEVGGLITGKLTPTLGRIIDKSKGTNMIFTSKQYLAIRKEILAQFDSAKDKASTHKVQTYHGCFVEEKIREWLKSFLPQRYGVCAGYVVSQELKVGKKHPHFDVIIYDALNSPILWVEDLSHNTTQSRAIPAEYVLAVIEVKSTLDTTTIEEAIDHINELNDVACNTNLPEERYKKYLPNTFFWGMIFVEIDSKTPSSKTICEKLINNRKIKKYYSSLILRRTNESINNDKSGCLKFVESEAKIQDSGSFGSFGMFFMNNQDPNGKYQGIMSTWGQMEFVTFEFDILALLNGTFKGGLVSSWYGMGELTQELPK
jgi:hypothetical protein